MRAIHEEAFQKAGFSESLESVTCADFIVEKHIDKFIQGHTVIATVCSYYMKILFLSTCSSGNSGLQRP